MRTNTMPILTLGLLFILGACSSSSTNREGATSADSMTEDQNEMDSGADSDEGVAEEEGGDEEDGQEEDMEAPGPSDLADVTAVSVTGEGPYRFSVTIASRETGCDRYADWWEVVSMEGELLFRLVLGHSHVTEQPFTRTGGPVEIAADMRVVVRAHLNEGGNGLFGGNEFIGSVASGFSLSNEVSAFPESIESLPPLPAPCAF